MPEAVALATADAEGLPSVRMVLAKGLDDRGFKFHTGHGSRKARELAATGRGALLFYWAPLGRQVRVEGPVERVPDDESEQYFRTRPRGGQIAAWASSQSEVIGSRDELDARVREFEREFEGTGRPAAAALGRLPPGAGDLGVLAAPRQPPPRSLPLLPPRWWGMDDRAPRPVNPDPRAPRPRRLLRRRRGAREPGAPPEAARRRRRPTRPRRRRDRELRRPPVRHPLGDELRRGAPPLPARSLRPAAAPDVLGLLEGGLEHGSPGRPDRRADRSRRGLPGRRRGGRRLQTRPAPSPRRCRRRCAAPRASPAPSGSRPPRWSRRSRATGGSRAAWSSSCPAGRRSSWRRSRSACCRASGPRSEARLRAVGIETIGALAALSDERLRQLLPGKVGELPPRPRPRDRPARARDSRRSGSRSATRRPSSGTSPTWSSCGPSSAGCPRRWLSTCAARARRPAP